MKRQIAVLLAMTALAGTAAAETHEVQMLNKGEDGAMVFEPAYIAAQPGDTIVFLPTDRSHNVESIGEMLPDEVAPFKSAFNEEYRLTVETEGLYGVKCTPHYAMGMVALIQVGDATNLDAAQGIKHRGKAAQRFEAAFAQVQ